MSPTKRERERQYQAKRHEKWAERYAYRQRRNRRFLLWGVLPTSLLACLALIVWGVVTSGSGSSGQAATATTAATAAATTSPTATSPSIDPKDPCPVPTATAPATPKSWDKAPDKSLAGGKTYTVTLTTSCGPIVLTLDGAKAPQGVASTIFLAGNGFYNDVSCHRLTTEGIYVLQCGDPGGDGKGGPGYNYGPVENAPANNVYPAGTVAMARVNNNASSMGSQFFLVYKTSTIPSDNAGGYTVLGKITSGMDILQKVAAGGHGTADEHPLRPLSIVSTSVAS